MCMFERRHYRAIAEAIKSFHVSSNEEAARYGNIITKLADLFAADNPNFKRQTFLDACK